MKKFLFSIAALIVLAGVSSACDYNNVRALILQNNVGYDYGHGVQQVQFLNNVGYGHALRQVQFLNNVYGHGVQRVIQPVVQKVVVQKQVVQPIVVQKQVVQKVIQPVVVRKQVVQKIVVH